MGLSFTHVASFLITPSGQSRGSGQSGGLQQIFIIIVSIFTTNNPGK